MSMNETKLSNEVRTVVRHFYAKLEDGEKVLLWGRGKVMQNSQRRIATFAALLVFILLFPVPFIWCHCQIVLAVVSRFEFFWLVELSEVIGIAIELCAIYAIYRCIAGSQSGWYVLTSH